jgi:dipeptidase D
VRDLFFAFSKFYRPPGQEDVVLGYLYALAEYANACIWDGRLSTERDPYGNFVIRVPAVGKKYCDPKLPPIALQSHTDMIVTVNPDNKQVLMNQLQTKGVLIEEVDGYYQSVGCQTTLGADDGIGMAFALRYLFDRSLPHPALELVFTVEEEIGLQGASNFKIGLEAPVLINLDRSVAGVVCIGCLGALRAGVKGTFASEQVDVANTNFIRIAVSKLKGGHSGNDIGKPRANAVKLMGQVLKHLQSYGLLRVVSAISGDRDISGVPTNLNAIASKFELILAFPINETPDLSEIEYYIKSYIWENYSDERASNVPNDIAATVSVAAYGAAPGIAALSHELSLQVTDVLNNVLNGILTIDGSFPTGWRTSSNLGFLEIKKQSSEKILFDIAYMARSYDPGDLEAKNNEIVAQLLAAWENVANPDGAAYTISGYAPWLGTADNWLVQLALSIPFFYKAEYASAGLEPGIFIANTQYCPNLKNAISIGPDILDAHSITERMRIETIKTTRDELQKLILKIADADEFKIP